MSDRPEYHPDHDANQLAGVVDAYRRRRPPKDIVPRTIPSDAPPIPTGPAEVVHTEVLTDQHTGCPVAVDQFTTRAWIAKPITKEDIK
jgi:hypothetical protein